MTTSRSPRSDYRGSHSVEGYGECYEKTYQHGYYYEQWKRLEEPLLREQFVRAKQRGASTLLDFACGTGRILKVAEEYFPATYGVDVSEPMLSVARQRCQNSLIEQNDITQQRLEARFDVISAFRFFLNAEPSLRVEVLRNLRGMLSPGGRLIANIHVNGSSPLGWAYRVRNAVLGVVKANTLTYDEFARTLTQSGFRVSEAYHYSYLPRTGPWLGGLSRFLMEPVERLCKALRVPKAMAQSFLLVCTVDEHVDHPPGS